MVREAFAKLSTEECYINCQISYFLWDLAIYVNYDREFFFKQCKISRLL